MRRYEYVECECQHAEHVVRFTLDEFSDESPELYIEVQLSQNHSFWKRFLLAIRYLFNKPSRFGHWNCTSISTDTAQKIIILCHQFKAASLNYAEHQSR